MTSTTTTIATRRHDFTYADTLDFGTIEYAPTDDPRILAVVIPDTSMGMESAPIGDALAPAYWLDHHYGWRNEGRAGDVFHDDASDAIFDALVHVMNEGPARGNDADFHARYLRIFHDTTYEVVSNYQGGQVVILNTPTFREHVGLPSDSENIDNRVIRGEVAEWRAFLDGEVYGIGYAVNMGRVLPAEDEEIDLDDDNWEIQSTCWGFFGVDSAREAAIAELEAPALPTMLDF